MKRKWKQLLSGCLALLFCVTVLPISYADEGTAGSIAPTAEGGLTAAEGTQDAELIDYGYCGDDVMWSLTDDGCLYIAGSGAMDEYYSSGPWTEKYQQQIVRVEVLEGVTRLGGTAFCCCHMLSKVSLPESLNEIGKFCFQECPLLEEILLPSHLELLEDGAFESCRGLNTVTIPASVRSIGPECFADCTALTEIRFTGSAPTIGEDAFLGTNVTAFYPANDPSWTEEVRQNYGGTIAWEQHVVEAELVASGQCGEELTWTLTKDGVLTISGSGKMTDWQGNPSAPWNDYTSSILNVVMEEGVTSIGARAFNGCWKLVCVAIPASVNQIGSSSFNWCNALQDILVAGENPAFKSVDGVLFSKNGTELLVYPRGRTGSYAVPDGTETICWNAFEDARGLSTALLPSSLRQIEAYAFTGCTGLTELTLPEGLLSIGGGAFRETGLREITFPASLRTCCLNDTGDAMFLNSPMENIYVSPDNPYFCSVDGVVFSKDKTELVMFPTGRSGSYTVPEHVTGLGEKSFDGAKLNELLLPPGLTEIGKMAFQFARELQTIRIPAHVTQLGYNAFAYTNMHEIRFYGSAPAFDPSCFAGITASVFYPENDPGWTADVRQNYGGTITWEPFVPGDLDGDGELNTADLMGLRQNLLGLQQDTGDSVDLNGDSQLDIRDLVRLRKLLAGAAG